MDKEISLTLCAFELYQVAQRETEIKTKDQRRRYVHSNDFLDSLLQALGHSPWDKTFPASHEIAHFMLASLDRRHLNDFGLGDPDIGGLDDEAVMEEELASILGILIEREHGLDWQETLDFHSWHTADVDRFMDRLIQLYDRHLIDEWARPTFVRKDTV